ncbi:hypothetical protein [Roseisolibacter agri]|uniref:Uncharacterized protein n=1 Tax=Roseisolibacter agri TaxID=2014610 RepID=A0AA37QEV5_9BACT|nr:hypothetical protein [Roseisolibacter agri]GLC25065.1 hypothetical protein rosag_15780 [Roseisolibacter agri]
MIASVIAEVRESATADLPGCIARVAALRGVELLDRVTVYDWWKSAAEFVAVQYPALFLTWDGSAAARREHTGRDSVTDLLLSYVFRSANMDEVQRHLLHVPEAVLTWLDEFPTLHRVEGKTVHAVAPGVEIEIGASVDRLKDGGLLWAVDIGPVPFHARDVAAP